MDWTQRFDQEISALLPDLRILREEPMSRHTSFRIGGPARRMAFPKTGEQVVLLLHLARECGARPVVLGNGTNVLVPDEGLDRLVVSTGDLSRLEADAHTGIMTADAGVSLAKLAELACRSGLTGLEFAHGIPGTAGGAVCMNAGAYDGAMKQVIQSARILFPDEGIRRLSPEELELGYRRSLLSDHPEAVVLDVVYQLSPGEESRIRERMRELMQRRKASQPLEFPSAGSTFKRPEGYFAGTLIDQCGLKGLRVGGAQVSPKHAGFVVNTGGATFADVTELIRQVQRHVFEEKGVTLEPEVKIISA